MAKTGIGVLNDDKNPNLSPRGLINALSVELVDASGNQITSFPVPGFAIPTYDYVTLTQTALVDTWVFKNGGVSGVLVATITITYTTSAKTIISTVVKT